MHSTRPHRRRRQQALARAAAPFDDDSTRDRSQCADTRWLDEAVRDERFAVRPAWIGGLLSVVLAIFVRMTENATADGERELLPVTAVAKLLRVDRGTIYRAILKARLDGALCRLRIECRNGQRLHGEVAALPGSRRQ